MPLAQQLAFLNFTTRIKYIFIVTVTGTLMCNGVDLKKALYI